MKEPDEIKKGLEYVSATNIARKVAIAKAGRMPYEYAEEAAADALAYIQQLETQLVNQATEYSQALKITTEQRDAAVADINMCCPCEVCTRSCTYDKVNPYDECADFEWRGMPEPPGEEV